VLLTIAEYETVRQGIITNRVPSSLTGQSWEVGRLGRSWLMSTTEPDQSVKGRICEAVLCQKLNPVISTLSDLSWISAAMIAIGVGNLMIF